MLEHRFCRCHGTHLWPRYDLRDIMIRTTRSEYVDFIPGRISSPTFRASLTLASMFYWSMISSAVLSILGPRCPKWTVLLVVILTVHMIQCLRCAYKCCFEYVRCANTTNCSCCPHAPGLTITVGTSVCWYPSAGGAGPPVQVGVHCHCSEGPRGHESRLHEYSVIAFWPKACTYIV